MRVAVLGAGRMGRRRAELLARNPAVKELVIGTRTRPPGEELAASLGARAASLGARAASLEEALGARPDAVVVAASTAAHPDLLRAALELRVPVLCEKPLSATLAASVAIASEADRLGVPVQVGYHRRFDPAFAAARSAVLSGRLGTLYSVSSVSYDHLPPGAEFSATSGGIWRDLHVHDFDLLRWLTGLEILSVSAVQGIRADERLAAYPDADTTAAVGMLEGGALLSVRGARHDPRGQDVRVELLGSGDSLAAGLDTRTPLGVLGADAQPFAGPAYSDFLERFAPAFAAETAAFVELASGRGPNPCPPSEDIAALQVALACMRSVESGAAEIVEGTGELAAEVAGGELSELGIADGTDEEEEEEHPR